MSNVKLIGAGFTTVGELVDALSQLDPSTPLSPFGSDNTLLFYVKSDDVAYLDEEYDWLDDEDIEDLEDQFQ